MFWLTLGLFFVVLGTLVLDWGRVRDWMPAALVGALLPGLFSAWPLPTTHRFMDTGPLSNPWAIELFTQVTIAPILAAWFVQGVPPGRRVPVLRIGLFALLTACILMLSNLAGKAEYLTPSWSWLPVSALLFLVIWKAHTYLSASGSPDRKGDRSARTR
jgi:hypothetical protein